MSWSNQRYLKNTNHWDNQYLAKILSLQTNTYLCGQSSQFFWSLNTPWSLFWNTGSRLYLFRVSSSWSVRAVKKSNASCKIYTHLINFVIASMQSNQKNSNNPWQDSWIWDVGFDWFATVQQHNDRIFNPIFSLFHLPCILVSLSSWKEPKKGTLHNSQSIRDKKTYITNLLLSDIDTLTPEFEDMPQLIRLIILKLTV